MKTEKTLKELGKIDRKLFIKNLTRMSVKDVITSSLLRKEV